MAFRQTKGTRSLVALCIALTCMLTISVACSSPTSSSSKLESEQIATDITDKSANSSDIASSSPSSPSASPSSESGKSESERSSPANAEEARALLDISEDYRDEFVHGEKGSMYQRYIVLHDTEGEADPASVVSSWDGSDKGVAAHFIVGKDGSIVQCVPLDNIAHHAGYGDAGHNDMYGVPEDGRDDMVGTTPIGDWAPDYGMNSYSVGIEMVHIGGSGDYPEEQLQALDNLIAYIDAYYGSESTIIDHKAWRSGNSDTSPEFAGYLENYQNHRTHA